MIFNKGLGWDYVFILMRNITAVFSDLHKLESPSPYLRLLGKKMFGYSEIFGFLEVNVEFISSLGIGKYPLIKHFNSGKNHMNILNK